MDEYDPTTVVYFQNPEMCNEQSYWVRDESEPRPSSQEIEETGAGADGYIGGKGWPINCPHCQNTRLCPHCGGDGLVFDPSPNEEGNLMTCPSCGGAKYCHYC